MRRKYQQGCVIQKGRRKEDGWFPKEAAYVKFWRDVPGQSEPRRETVSLGVCRTRTIAERAAAEKLEQLGINSAQTPRSLCTPGRMRTAPCRRGIGTRNRKAHF